VKRIDWVDFGKGFSIFLVLVGHVLLGLFQSNKFTNSNEALMIFIEQLYIFHIPVFFALSGYFFKPIKSIYDFILFTKKKTIILGLPYIFYSIIHYILQKVAGSTVRNPTSYMDLINIYKHPLGVSWYLYTLWGIFIFYGFISIVIKNKRIMLFISFIGLVLSMLINVENLLISKVLVWGVFFVLGSVFREIGFETLFSKRINKIFIYTLLFMDAIYMIIWKNLSGKQVDYGNPKLWSVGFFISIILAFLVFPNVKSKLPNMFDYFTKYGKESLGIYILHAPICSMLRIVVLKIGITSIYFHVIIGIALGWCLSILAVKLLKRIPYLNIILLPQNYIKFDR